MAFGQGTRFLTILNPARSRSRTQEPWVSEFLTLESTALDGCSNGDACIDYQPVEDDRRPSGSPPTGRSSATGSTWPPSRPPCLARPVGRRGENGRRVWWRCPLGTHADANPSFAIEPGKPWWRCYGCGEHGDAASLVMRLQGWPFTEAVEWLAERVRRCADIDLTPRPLDGTEAPGRRPR